MWTKEEVILDQIRDVFRAIQVPKDVLADIVDSLKKGHLAEKGYHQASVKSLRNEEDQITTKLDKLLDMLMEEKITQDMYNRTHTQLIQRRQEIQELLERHHAGDEQFRMAVTTLVTLASKAAEIFDCSQTDEKSQLIGYVFANLELKGGKVQYSLKKPFDLLADLESYQKWLPRKGSNLRPGD